MTQVASPLSSVVAAPAKPWVIQYSFGGPVPVAARNWSEDGTASSFRGEHVDVFVAGRLFEPQAPASAGRNAHSAEATPAQLVHALYETQGIDLLDEIRGHCALVIVDRRQRRLLAARDQMGQHPLFYAQTPDAVLLSSSIAALLEQPGVSGELNRLVIAEHLQQRWVDQNETFYRAVRRVPPGHVLEIAGDAVRVRCYWDPAAGAREPMNDADAVERFDAVFERAVARAVGRGRAAIFLSGGFDSVSIAAMATMLSRRNGSPPLQALSLVFVDPECDEQFVQRSVAETLGLQQHLITVDHGVGGSGLLMRALDLGASWPAPLLNLWAPAYHELAAIGRRQGCETILTGTGGDEWLNVTPCLSADLMRRGQLVQLAHFIRVLQRSFRTNGARILQSALWTFGLRRLIGSAAATLAPATWDASRRRREVAKTYSWIAPDPGLRREMDDRVGRLLPAARPGPGGFYECELRGALTHPLVSMEYEEHFEFGKRAGVTLAHPYLDADLVQLLCGMSPVALTSGGRTKGLVRTAVARQFPNLGFEGHRKVSATSFYRSVMKREGANAWKAAERVGALADLGVLDRDAFGRVASDLLAGRRSDLFLIWNVLNLNAWVRARVGI